MPATIMTGAKFQIKTLLLTTKIEFKIVDWLSWLTSNKKMTMSELHFLIGLEISLINIILTVLELILSLKFRNGSGVNSLRLQEFTQLVKFLMDL